VCRQRKGAADIANGTQKTEESEGFQTTAGVYRTMILFIHGFSSHGYGGKARALREYYTKKNEPFIAPSLSYVPELAMQTLVRLLTKSFLISPNFFCLSIITKLTITTPIIRKVSNMVIPKLTKA